MLTPFSQQTYIATHYTTLAALTAFGIAVVLFGRALKTDESRKRYRMALVILIIVMRVIRYPIDASVGLFTWDAVFSLHVCHLNLILLIICMIRPNRFLFSYCFLIGIPMGLVSGIFPGDVPLDAPIPMLRGVLFIITHLLMVIYAVYLAVVEKMRPTWRHLGLLYLVASVQTILTYGVNRLFGTNFLYIMTPVTGTPIQTLSDQFGWPGYALAMVGITFVLMAVMMLIFWAIEKHRS